MITYYKGTVFNTESKALVNTVNIVGIMGTGIALEFSLRFPDMYKDYLSKCTSKELIVGRIHYYRDSSDITIVNFPTKWHFKFPSKIEWIESGLRDFVSTYKENGITSIAFPKLGCSNGGLQWEQVKPLMEKYLCDIDAHVFICLDQLQHAEGKEEEMVYNYNKTPTQTLSHHIKLTKKQIVNLEERGPVKRFWHISEIPTIGDKTYRSIFNFFYSHKQGDNLDVQTTLF